MSERLESQLRQALERRASDMPDEAYERLREIDYRPRSPAAGLALGVAGLAALGAAVGIWLSLIVIGFGGGTQRAFAGWSPTPTTPRPGQRAIAERACTGRAAGFIDESIQGFREMRLYEQRHGHPSIHPPPKNGGPLRTVLADTRGPYTFAMLTDGETDVQCLVGPGPSEVTGLGGQSPSGSHVPVGTDQTVLISLGLTRAGNEKPFKYVSGRAGKGVRAVTVVLVHGRRISATVGHGWYLAWWPGMESMAAIEAVSARGKSTQRFKDNRPARR